MRVATHNYKKLNVQLPHIIFFFLISNVVTVIYRPRKAYKNNTAGLTTDAVEKLALKICGQCDFSD